MVISIFGLSPPLRILALPHNGPTPGSETSKMTFLSRLAKSALAQLCPDFNWKGSFEEGEQHLSFLAPVLWLT